MIDATPFAGLTPDTILTAVESIGLRCNGSLYALNSYENRVYQIGIEDEAPLIAKFYRSGRWSNEAILEEHHFALELMHHELPVIAPLAYDSTTLHHYQGFRFALFPRRGGRPFELNNYEYLQSIGRFLGRLHAVGASHSFQHRIRIDTESYGRVPSHFLIENNLIPLSLHSRYHHTVQQALLQAAQCFETVKGVNYLRLHGDCHPGNILWQEGPHIVDLDDCLMGPAIQDIWMLLAGDTPHENRTQLNYLLDGYYEFHEFDLREIRLIEALRTLRMIHYAAWLAKRWADPAFPQNFPWFGSESYWQQHINHLEDQLYQMEQNEKLS